MAQMWIDGRSVDAVDGRVFDVVNPATEEVVDTAPPVLERAPELEEDWGE